MGGAGEAENSLSKGLEVWTLKQLRVLWASRLEAWPPASPWSPHEACQAVWTSRDPGCKQEKTILANLSRKGVY